MKTLAATIDKFVDDIHEATKLELEIALSDVEEAYNELSTPAYRRTMYRRVAHILRQTIKDF